MTAATSASASPGAKIGAVSHATYTRGSSIRSATTARRGNVTGGVSTGRRETGAAARSVRTVAIVCGAGGELLHDAVRAQADVFLTGEARFHDFLAAQAAGMALVLPGHYATERCGVEELAGDLQKQFPDVQVWASAREQDPVSVA